MATWREEIERPVTRLEVGGFRPTERREASTFGRVCLARPGEAWPTWRDKPLWPLCQLNISEAQYLPKNLGDLCMISIYIAEPLVDSLTFCIGITNDESDHPWRMRTYQNFEDLVELKSPQLDSPIRPFEARWRAVERDYPTHDLIPIELPPDIEENYYGIDGITTLEGTKLGGWPSCIQSEPWWDYQADGAEFEYALQVDSEEKAA